MSFQGFFFLQNTIYNDNNLNPHKTKKLLKPTYVHKDHIKNNCKILSFRHVLPLLLLDCNFLHTYTHTSNIELQTQKFIVSSKIK